jgi:dethiobiotin synthetase
VADLLVTGTDTGVGKTVVAAAIVTALRAKGVRALGFKPAETGVQDGHESDSEILARASGEHAPHAAPLLRLHEALAPAVAAERAGTAIDPRDIESRVEFWRREGWSLVIEGAGGVMVPLAWGYTALDLAERLALEVVVVGRAGLGTLNHVAMTVAMLRTRNLSIRGVVLNGRKTPPDPAECTNPSALARMLPGLPIVVVPYHPDDAVARTVPVIVPLLAGHQ